MVIISDTDNSLYGALVIDMLFTAVLKSITFCRVLEYPLKGMVRIENIPFLQVKAVIWVLETFTKLIPPKLETIQRSPNGNK